VTPAEIRKPELAGQTPNALRVKRAIESAWPQRALSERLSPINDAERSSAVLPADNVAVTPLSTASPPATTGGCAYDAIAAHAGKQPASDDTRNTQTVC